MRATISTQLALMSLDRNLCKLKHAQTFLYYDQVAWIPLISPLKSFRELHSHALYIMKFVIYTDHVVFRRMWWLKMLLGWGRQ